MSHPHSHFPQVTVGRKESLVFFVRNREHLVRRYIKPRNPRTPRQMENRGVHTQLTAISGVTKEFRQFCFQGLDTYRSSHTAFIGLQMCQLKRALDGVDKPLEARLRWGYGPLPGVRSLGFSWEPTPVLQWTMDKHFSIQRSDFHNRSLWIAWNATRGAWQWSLNGGYRFEGRCDLSLPQEWRGEEIYLWLLFCDAYNNRFSRDTCLHVERGMQTACLEEVVEPLYTAQGVTFAYLINNWLFSRALMPGERREVRKDLRL